MLLTICSCANSIDENHNDESLQSQLDDSANSETTNDTFNKETEKQPSVTTTEQLKKNEPILADLNHGGTDDKIIITYDDEQKSSATIKVINGKDDSELMSDTLKLNANKVGAYYLQKGKGNERDRLYFGIMAIWKAVSWHSIIVSLAMNRMVKPFMVIVAVKPLMCHMMPQSQADIKFPW